MPISQTRLYSLLAAAESLELKYTLLCHSLQTQLNTLAGAMPEEARLLLVAQVSNPDIATLEESKTIITERTAYRLTHRKNERERDYRRERKLRQLQDKSPEPSNTFLDTEDDLNAEDDLIDNIMNKDSNGTTNLETLSSSPLQPRSTG